MPRTIRPIPFTNKTLGLLLRGPRVKTLVRQVGMERMKEDQRPLAGDTGSRTSPSTVSMAPPSSSSGMMNAKMM